MEPTKVLYALAYGAPVVTVVLLCAFIGFRVRGWQGLAVGASIPTVLLCFGRAYQWADKLAGAAGASQTDARTALATALIPAFFCFGVLYHSEQAALDCFRKDGKWVAGTVTGTAVIGCLLVSWMSVEWFYDRLFPFEELTFALVCWGALGTATVFGATELAKPNVGKN